MKGRIIKGIAGFYYVSDNNKITECHAKGRFRYDGMSPLVGDFVTFDIIDGLTEDGLLQGHIKSILPRKNSLIRPAAANIDCALVIFALKDPAPDISLLDRILVTMEYYDIKSFIVFNKSDLAKKEYADELSARYKKIGYKTFVTDARDKIGLSEVRKAIEGQVTAVAGPSGAGKSTIINYLAGREHMETGEISRKNRRGKNTTRHAELLEIGKDSYILDTPGFSSFRIPDMDPAGLTACFPEFMPFYPKCKYRECSHISEPDCAVKEALESGIIDRTRYYDYLLMYNDLKERKRFR
jgi:ribosome biogenesis GTPase